VQRDRHVAILPLASCVRGLRCRSAACSATATSRSCGWRLACGASDVGALRAARPPRLDLAAGVLSARLFCRRKRQNVSRRCRGASRRPCLCKASCTSNTPPAVRRAPSWRAVPCASRSPRESAECASCARGRLAAIPGRDPFGAETLGALRCSADLRGPRWTNPPSMAGCFGLPIVLLLLLGARHGRSDSLANSLGPAMDGGFVDWGP